MSTMKNSKKISSSRGLRITSIPWEISRIWNRPLTQYINTLKALSLRVKKTHPRIKMRNHSNGNLKRRKKGRSTNTHWKMRGGDFLPKSVVLANKKSRIDILMLLIRLLRSLKTFNREDSRWRDKECLIRNTSTGASIETNRMKSKTLSNCLFKKIRN